MLTDADAEAFDAVIGQWRSGLAGFTTELAAGDDGDVPGCVQVRLDGKTIRGAKDAEGNQTQLLAVLVGPDAATSVVAAQTEVGAMTNEVPMAADVLGQIDLNNKIVTADALHTVKATAEHIHERGGQFVLPVKENRRSLFDALDALAWKEVPIAHRDTDNGHGRITTRTIQVLPAHRIRHSRTSIKYSLRWRQRVGYPVSWCDVVVGVVAARSNGVTRPSWMAWRSFLWSVGAALPGRGVR